jgi:hypothetical protein
MYVKQNDASRLIHMMTQLDISYSIWGVRVQIANFRGEIGNLGGKLAIWGAKELIRNLGFLAAIWKGPNCRVFHRLSLFRLLCNRSGALLLSLYALLEGKMKNIIYSSRIAAPSVLVRY